VSPLTFLLVAADAVFALRALDVFLRSQTSIERREPSSELPSLSIIVPARNEERQIERCVRSLLATRHPDFELIVLDDRSSDATRAILESIAREEPRLRVVAGLPLPEGWIGKSWALAQGAKASRGAWLLFTDADTVHEPIAAASAQSWAIEHRCAALSLLTDQETESLAERLFLPTILFVILIAIGPLEEINDPCRTDVALFNGQYVLASREAYDAIGGHAAVRGEIAEDLELARLFKRDGRFRTALVGANALVRTRMYRSLGEIWGGFVKNFGIGAKGQAGKAIAGVTLIACVSPLTPILFLVMAARRRWWSAVALALAGGAVIGVAECAMRAMRFRRGSGLGVPLALALTQAIFATSLARDYGGCGVEWRGRRYGGGFGASR
jgi:chlorobactene glucosyltransferase